ncbi:acid-sensing ion channel 2-like [Ornithodoros turicata]|uniref:acid-sensing ion channel 2-like n=1 Tax=Ornithodoros turicata TaxID=34597 RepID=UPI00313A2415
MVHPDADGAWNYNSGVIRPRKGIHDVWLAPYETAERQRRRKLIRRFRLAARLCRFKERDKEPLEKLKELFAESTTGIDRLVVIENRYRFWVFCTVYVVFFILTLFSIGKTLQNHFEHRDIVSISMYEGNTLLLPAVTFCNLNPVRRSALCSEIGSSESELEIKRELCAKLGPMDVDDAENFTRDHFSSYMHYITKQNGTLPLIAHSKSDMVLNCTVKGENCLDDSLYHPKPNPKFGMCYCIFCDDANKTMVSYKASNLPVDGLTLVFDTEKHEYLRSTLETGVIVMVHRRGVKPDPNEDGMYLAPYMTTYIGIETRIMERLPAPYKDRCVQGWPKKWLQYIHHDNTYFQQVRRKLCFSVCAQVAIRQHCHCHSEELIYLVDNTLSACKEDEKTKNCSDTIMADLAYRSLEKCDCPLKCSQEIYKTSISRTGWAQRLVQRKVDNDLFKRALVKVVIYLESVIVERITQVPEVSDATTLSNVGGFMGMYLGLSFLVIFEILEILFRWGIYLWKRRYKPQDSIAVPHREGARGKSDENKENYFRNLRLGSNARVKPLGIAKLSDGAQYGYFDSTYWKSAMDKHYGSLNSRGLFQKMPLFR